LVRAPEPAFRRILEDAGSGVSRPRRGAGTRPIACQIHSQINSPPGAAEAGRPKSSRVHRPRTHSEMGWLRGVTLAAARGAKSCASRVAAFLHGALTPGSMKHKGGGSRGHIVATPADGSQTGRARSCRMVSASTMQLQATLRGPRNGTWCNAGTERLCRLQIGQDSSLDASKSSSVSRPMSTPTNRLCDSHHQRRQFRR
jgi:hypothetical protein